MKKITNQKIDIPKLFERYITYICSSYKGYEFEDPLKSARRFIRDFYPNKKLIKNLLSTYYTKIQLRGIMLADVVGNIF